MTLALSLPARSPAAGGWSIFRNWRHWISGENATNEESSLAAVTGSAHPAGRRGAILIPRRRRRTSLIQRSHALYYGSRHRLAAAALTAPRSEPVGARVLAEIVLFAPPRASRLPRADPAAPDRRGRSGPALGRDGFGAALGVLRRCSACTTFVRRDPSRRAELCGARSAGGAWCDRARLSGRGARSRDAARWRCQASSMNATVRPLWGMRSCMCRRLCALAAHRLRG